MEDFIDRRVKGFSQGQRIKVALARALVHDPGNVVLDEPTNGLDVMAIRNLREMLRALKAQGRCILFSSHVMQEVAALCDRVVIIGHGRVLADDTPQAIRERSGTATLEEAFLHVLGECRGRELMRALLTVFAKEFLENLRDRRTLMSALLFGPLFGPVLFGGMVSQHARVKAWPNPTNRSHLIDLGQRIMRRGWCAISNRRACSSTLHRCRKPARARPCAAARRRWC